MGDEGAGCEGHDWSFVLVQYPILVSPSNPSSLIITTQPERNSLSKEEKSYKDSHSSTQSSLGPLWSGFSPWALTRWAHSSKWCFKGAHWAECSHSVNPVGGYVSNVCEVRLSGCDVRMAWWIWKFGLTVLSQRWALQYSWRSRRSLEGTKKFFRWITSFSNKALSRQGL